MRRLRSFGVHEMTLSKWMCQASVEVGEKPGVTRPESTENRELKRRIRLPNRRNEVLRRAAGYLPQTNLPAKAAAQAAGYRTPLTASCPEG